MPNEKKTKPDHVRFTEENADKIRKLCDELDRDKPWVINEVLNIGFDTLDLIKTYGRRL